MSAKQTESKGPEGRQLPRNRKQAPTAVSFFVGDSLGNAQLTGDIFAHAVNWNQRQTAVLQMQQQRGNAYTQRYLARGAQIAQLEEDDLPLDTAGLGKEEELIGHPNQGIHAHVQRENGEAEPSPAAPAAPATTATVNFTVNPPTIERKSEAEISTAHGRPNTTGWCTPSYSIAVTSRSRLAIAINITLDFRIELASEYTGDRLTVLQEHEQGHVVLGTRLARETLETGLKGRLEALPNFVNPAPIQAAIANAGSAFETREGADSQAFDTSDYPRMREAYYGVRTPLATLSAADSVVQSMVTAVNAFNNQARSDAVAEDGSDNAQLSQAAQAVTNAYHALGSVNLARLQYNPEFKALVAIAQQSADALDFTMPEISEMRTTLNNFTWTPSV